MTTYGSDPTTPTTGGGLGAPGSSTGLGTTGTGTGLGTTDPLSGLGATDTALDRDGGTDQSTKHKATEAASTAADQGKQVAGTAKDEAANVAGTAADQARTVLTDAKQQVTSQVTDQATTGRDKLSETLRTLGDDLQQMAQGQGPSQGMATDLAQEVSDRVRALGTHLENREPSQLLDDARDFARRRPGTFLLGALAAGVVAGRLFRATADGAAAASLADTDGTARTTAGAGLGAGTTGVGTGAMGTGPMGTAGGYAPSTEGYDTPATAGYDTPATTAPAPVTPSVVDPGVDDVTGHRTQDLP